MLSYTGTILAVALPLVACLAVLFIILLRQRRLLQWHRKKYDKVKEKLATFPSAWTKMDQDEGFNHGEVLDSFRNVSVAIDDYVTKWIGSGGDGHGGDSVSPDSVKRIESILFTSPPPVDIYGRDASLFANPHSYSAAEIVAYLEQKKHGRDVMAIHILTAVMLRALSFEGAPSNSILSFTARDIDNLEKLLHEVHRLKLYGLVRVHVGKFGIYYRQPHAANKELYFDLFESLFEPYYTSKSPSEVYKRKKQFYDLLDVAHEHGLKVIGCSSGRIGYRWGAKEEGTVVANPELTGETEQGRSTFTNVLCPISAYKRR